MFKGLAKDSDVSFVWLGSALFKITSHHLGGNSNICISPTVFILAEVRSTWRSLKNRVFLRFNSFI